MKKFQLNKNCNYVIIILYRVPVNKTAGTFLLSRGVECEINCIRIAAN